MLFMAGQHVAEGEFDARCKRMLEVLGNWRKRRGDDWMPHWYLSRRLGWSDRDIEEVRNALVSQRRIAYEIGSTTGGGPVALRYRLLRSGQEGLLAGLAVTAELPPSKAVTGDHAEVVTDVAA